MIDTELLARVRRAWPTMSEREKHAFRQWIANQTDPGGGGLDAFADEQFWEHSAYMDAIGNLLMLRCTFGQEWETKPKTLYSTWDDFSGDYSGQVHADTEWGCWGTTGLAHAVLNLWGPTQKNITFRNCAWLAAPHPVSGNPSTMRWGVRGFAMMDVQFVDCSFSRGMGAGTQVALRAAAAGGDITPKGTHRYQSCTYNGIGDPKNPERWGAFTISEHAPEGYDFQIADVSVEIVDCSLTGGHLNWIDGNGQLVQSPRGIMANGRDRVFISNLHLDYPKPYSGWSIQLWNDRHVEIAASYVREGLVEIRNPQTVRVHGCTGGALLKVWANSVPDGYGGWVGGTLIHEGPLAQGYTLG